MSRIKILECQLSSAQDQIKSLKDENRILKVMQIRLDNALSKYEGTHSQLPLLVRTYDEDIRTLQTRLRRTKKSYRELENQHRLQSDELLTVKKDNKHLFDLTKNKQLGEREKLSNQLEEAENTIKQQEVKIQKLVKKINLLYMNHEDQRNAMISKIKQLQLALNRANEINKQLEMKTEKLKFQNFGGRRSNIMVTRHNAVNSSSVLIDQTKQSMVDNVIYDDTKDPTMQSSDEPKKELLKPELVHGESEISDHTKELQKNLMSQIHEDVINKPHMLVKNDKVKTSDAMLWLNRNISDMIKEIDLLNEREDNIVQEIEPTVVSNPFSI